MKNWVVAALLVGASVSVSSAASAAQQILSFSGNLDYGSTYGASPYGPSGFNLTGQSFAITLAYDPASFANLGSCGAVPNNSCTFTLTGARPVQTKVQIGSSATQTYDWTAGQFTLSSSTSSGPDIFGFSLTGNGGGFSGSFQDGNAFYANQNAVNNAQLANFTNLGLASGTFQQNGVTFGFGDNPGTLSSAYTSVTAVPEPATWAMMLVGFGGIGYSMRRRRKPITSLQVA